MQRREGHFLTGLAAIVLLISWAVATPASAKEETVALSITGMT